MTAKPDAPITDILSDEMLALRHTTLLWLEATGWKMCPTDIILHQDCDNMVSRADTMRCITCHVDDLLRRVHEGRKQAPA